MSTNVQRKIGNTPLTEREAVSLLGSDIVSPELTQQLLANAALCGTPIAAYAAVEDYAMEDQNAIYPIGSKPTPGNWFPTVFVTVVYELPDTQFSEINRTVQAAAVTISAGEAEQELREAEAAAEAAAARLNEARQRFESLSN